MILAGKTQYYVSKGLKSVRLKEDNTVGSLDSVANLCK